ncbi:MAG: YbjN domain-containing protein [Clostridiales bacterium]|nr:YbjN domain-containing protein [Clostridiales bacterium]
MNSAAQSYIDTLKKNNVNAKDVYETKNGKTVVKCGWNLKSTTIDVLVAFSEDCKYVEIRCFSFAKAPQDRLGQVMIACNELNKKYKWVKFYVDDDCEVNAEDDAIIDATTAGDECFELMVRMAGIVDEAYPVIMKAVYA